MPAKHSQCATLTKGTWIMCIEKKMKADKPLIREGEKDNKNKVVSKHIM